MRITFPVTTLTLLSFMTFSAAASAQVKMMTVRPYDNPNHLSVHQDRNPQTSAGSRHVSTSPERSVEPKPRQARHVPPHQKIGQRRQTKSQRVKAEIDALDSELRHAGADWQIVIEYEIEIEGRSDHDQFVLVLELWEDHRPAIDENGVPLVMEIALDRPSERDDDEVKFEDRISTTVPKTWITDDDDLELKAQLVRMSDGIIVDTENDSVNRQRPRRIGVGVGWGIGCGVGVGIGIGF